MFPWRAKLAHVAHEVLLDAQEPKQVRQNRLSESNPICEFNETEKGTAGLGELI
jgi:hypothetical protein